MGWGSPGESGHRVNGIKEQRECCLYNWRHLFQKCWREGRENDCEWQLACPHGQRCAVLD